MDANALVPGEYIKAAEFGSIIPPTPTWAIRSVQIEKVPSMKKQGKDVDKGIVYFREIERGWVMNRTNVECLKAMFGNETDGWVGKRVSLTKERVQVGPKQEDGIRVVGSPDIDHEIVAEWQPPKKAKQTRRLVPTGQRNGGQVQQQRSNSNEPPLAAFKTAVGNQLKLDADAVVTWAKETGIDLASLKPDDLRGFYETIRPGGTRRERLDEFLASTRQE